MPKNKDGTPCTIIFCNIGADIGGNKSATSYVCTGFFIKDGKLAIIALDELYDKENHSNRINNQKTLRSLQNNRKSCILLPTDMLTVQSSL